MKNKLFLILLIGLSFGTKAQNTFPTNGNVGIGTTNTGNGLLTLNGTNTNLLRLENDVPGKEAMLRFRSKSITGGFLHSDISLYATGGNQGYLGFKVPHNNIANTGYDMVINHNGNVGIGTTSPEHKLDINTGGGNLKTYTYGLEHTVNTTGGWARAFRLRNENDNKTAVFGSLHGNAYISVGFDISEDATGYKNQKFTINRNGYVGIGTTSPEHKLDINTGGGNLKTYTYGLEHTVNTTGGWARAFRLRNENDNKTAVFGSLHGNAYISVGFDISEDATGYKNQKFTINRNGNVGIGTTSPDSKLTVKGLIHSREVKVTAIAGGADFVFENEYDLPSLEKVENYIKKNKHLPEIASAKDMEKDGIHLAEMNIKLLQKIEELTLYTIQQQKEITEQKKEVEKQAKEIDSLKSLAERLTKIEEKLKKNN